MHDQTIDAKEPPSRARRSPAADFPVREYIGAMSLELAQMARWDGDHRLADLLEAASEAAGRAPESADAAAKAD